MRPRVVYDDPKRVVRPEHHRIDRCQAEEERRSRRLAFAPHFHGDERRSIDLDLEHLDRSHQPVGRPPLALSTVEKSRAIAGRPIGPPA